jgi:hypothetical protein
MKEGANPAKMASMSSSAFAFSMRRSIFAAFLSVA